MKLLKPLIFYFFKSFHDSLSYKHLDAASKPDVSEKTPEGILNRKTK